MPRLLSGRYRLIERVQTSETSAVWRAQDEVLRRRVAVKLFAARPHDGERLRAGVQVAAVLNHPNVSAVYDYGVAGDEAFVVTELIEGTSLHARLARGPLPWRAAVEVCAYVCAALSAAHERGLAHGGISPATIMLTEAGVKVVDFDDAAITGIDPRQLRGRVRGPAADVYAVGVVLFTALTGHPPQRAGRAALLREDAEPPPLPLIAGMPLEVAALYQDCLAPEPSLRPSSAALAQRLAALAGVRVGAVDVRMASVDDTLNRRGTRELPAAAPSPPARPRSRRARTAIVATAVALAVGFAGAAAAVGLVRSGTLRSSGSSGPAHWSPGSTTPAPSTPAPAANASNDPPTGPCTVAYQVKQAWADGATVSLSVTNRGSADVRQWALSFDVDGQVRTGSGWNGVWQQQGRTVTVTGLSGHTDLAAGASVTDVGVNVDGQHAGTIPDRFVLNGKRCQVASQP